MANHNKKKTTYPAETTGRLMASNVPVVPSTATVGDVKRLLFKKTKAFETINYIYVVDAAHKLKGVLSIKELFHAAKQIPVKSLMSTNIISVRAYTDQERAALLALKHNIKSVPVVDKENTFLGAVPSDTILQILNTEAVEDILLLGGVFHKGKIDNIFNLPLIASLKHRLPWLIAGLLGGIITAGIVSSFEQILSQKLILVAFIPLVMYMAGASGTQMLAFIIRDLAMNPPFRLAPYFLRHALVVLCIGIIISTLLFGISFLLYNTVTISFVLGIALFLAIVSSLLTGLLVPYAFNKLKLDPANASGPIITIVQDIISIVVYLSIASLIL